ncbi:CoA transferase [Amycolatopsis thermophila]|uniref:CoA transferase n=1 Tax=Amycolatopsis thermophila TaxID=206084 RepID=UPI0027D7F999|nr:CoA transferase [Amycolatopsis thermophila]
MAKTSPLAGMHVLELTGARAGRTAGMLLADLGADVLRRGIRPRRPVPQSWGPGP